MSLHCRNNQLAALSVASTTVGASTTASVAPSSTSPKSPSSTSSTSASVSAAAAAAQQMAAAAAAAAGHPGFNSYTGQLAVTDAAATAANGQWAEGVFNDIF